MAGFSLLSVKEYKDSLEEPVDSIVKCFESIADKTVLSTASVSHGKVALSATLVMGLHTMLHVFRTILLYTRSLDLAAHHASKAGVYFSEFVTQISDDGQHYLQLTPKDAVLFAYKKTLYDLNSDYRTRFDMMEHEKEKMGKISSALTLSLRVRCRDLEESIGEEGATAVGNVNRRHRGFAQALVACTIQDINVVSDFVDIATSSDVSAITARSWASAIVRRARRKGGRPSMQRGRRLMTGDISRMTPARVAAEVVV